jgi:hypothetical protein
LVDGRARTCDWDDGGRVGSGESGGDVVRSITSLWDIFARSAGLTGWGKGCWRRWFGMVVKPRGSVSWLDSRCKWQRLIIVQGVVDCCRGEYNRRPTRRKKYKDVFIVAKVFNAAVLWEQLRNWECEYANIQIHATDEPKAASRQMPGQGSDFKCQALAEVEVKPVLRGRLL